MRAAFAAVVLGCIEVFGSPRGRRYLAVAPRWSAARCSWSCARPCRWSRPARSACASTASRAASSVVPEGPTLMLPLLHELRRYTLRDQVYRPAGERHGGGRGAVPVGRGAFGRRGGDRPLRARSARASARWRSACPRTSAPISIEPVVDGVLHRALSLHTVREIFTDKRVEIQDDIQAELRELLAQGRHHRALALPRAHRSAGAVPRGPGRDALRGAGHGEDALHAAAQGEEGEGVGAGGRRRQGASARRPPRPRPPRRSSPPRRARRR